jgi:hypothetical protein
MKEYDEKGDQTKQIGKSARKRVSCLYQGISMHMLWCLGAVNRRSLPGLKLQDQAQL